MYKICKVLLGLCVAASALSYTPAYAVEWSVEDEAKSLYSSIKSDFNTMQSNYGNLGSSNMSEGYKNYLNKVNENDSNLKLKSELLKQELGSYKVNMGESSQKEESDGQVEDDAAKGDSFDVLKKQILATQNTVSQEKQKASETKYSNVVAGWHINLKAANQAIGGQTLDLSGVKGDVNSAKNTINSAKKTNASKISAANSSKKNNSKDLTSSGKKELNAVKNTSIASSFVETAWKDVTGVIDDVTDYLDGWS